MEGVRLDQSYYEGHLALWLRLVDAFTQPRMKAKRLGCFDIPDFGKHQVWATVEGDWDSINNEGELLFRPLKFREYCTLKGTLAIGSVLRASDGQTKAGSIVAQVDGRSLQVIGLLLFEGRLSICRIQDRLLGETHRDAILRDRPELIALFPLTYETWVPLEGQLAQIKGTIAWSQ